VTIPNSAKIVDMKAVGSVSIYALLATIVALLIGFIILARGVKKGIAKVNLIVMPIFFVMLLVLVIYALTLSGANIGLNKMFYPDLKKLANFSPWKDAFMHAFYTLGIGLGMIFVFSKQTGEHHHYSKDCRKYYCIHIFLINTLLKV
jgi:NSS family neurotransmitter:Na+ symporter